MKKQPQTLKFLAVSAGPYQADEKRAEIVLLSNALSVKVYYDKLSMVVCDMDHRGGMFL